MNTVRLDGMRFVNESGNQVLFHGINVLARDRKDGHRYPWIYQAMPYFQRSGFNLIRLGIFWDGAEPEPGKIDYGYLEKLREIVGLAEKHGIYVILDMHQDLFAQKFIDGAPDWACLDEGLPHPANCDLWYQAYLSSDAIIRAADNFWANKPAADGIGLLDHYSAMWEEIAKVFDSCPNLLGFEPMNEPFMGSIARNSFGEASAVMAQKYPGFDLAHPEKITPQAQGEFMGLIAQRFLEFDRTTLMDFYRRMERAIRKHSEKPVVTGGNIYCSTNLPTGIQRLGSAQIFAPHGYDTVVDSDRYDNFSRENVERLYAEKRQDQERLALPTIVGEWGAFPSKEFTGDLIRHMNGILERYLWGDAYCEYHPGMENDQHFDALRRGYPMETGGNLLRYHDDPQESRFEMEFEAKAGGETVIYCPFTPKGITCSLTWEENRQLLESGACLCRVTVKEGGQAKLVLEG